MRWFSKALVLSLCFIAIASAQTIGPPGGGGGPPTGAAGGSLTGTYPNPGLNVGGTTTGTLAAVNGGVDTTAWTGFTPSPSCGTATFTTNSGRFKTIGKTTYVQVDFTVTAIGTCTTTVVFTLPATANSTASLTEVEIGVSNLVGVCRVVASSTAVSCLQNASTAFLLNAHLVISGLYENQ